MKLESLKTAVGAKCSYCHNSILETKDAVIRVTPDGIKPEMWHWKCYYESLKEKKV